MASASLLSSAAPSSHPCCTAWAPVHTWSCTDLCGLLQRRGCSDKGPHVHTLAVTVSGWRMDFQQDIFFSCLIFLGLVLSKVVVFVGFFFCLFYKISVLLCNVFPIKCKIHCRTGGFLELHNCLAVTVLAGPWFMYNSSTVLTQYITSALANIQALEQTEALRKGNICWLVVCHCLQAFTGHLVQVSKL